MVFFYAHSTRTTFDDDTKCSENVSITICLVVQFCSIMINNTILFVQRIGAVVTLVNDCFMVKRLLLRVMLWICRFRLFCLSWWWRKIVHFWVFSSFSFCETFLTWKFLQWPCYALFLRKFLQGPFVKFVSHQNFFRDPSWNSFFVKISSVSPRKALFLIKFPQGHPVKIVCHRISSVTPHKALFRNKFLSDPLWNSFFIKISSGTPRKVCFSSRPIVKLFS